MSLERNSFMFQHPLARFVSLACLLGLSACKPVDMRPEPVRAVKLIQIQATDVQAGVEFAGDVRARVESRLGFRVAGKLVAQDGKITRSSKLRIGYFAQQELDVLRPADNPLEHMIALAKKLGADGRLSGQSTREQDLRNFLGTFNFSGEMVNQTVGTMSGGEKARLVLAMMVWQRPNLLLLDEPFSKLDQTLRAQIRDLVFAETRNLPVILVTHDPEDARAAGGPVVSPI